MNKTMIVSSHKVLNNLYEVNLFAYVDVQCQVFQKPIDALNALDEDAKYRALLINNDGIPPEEIELLVEKVSERIKGIIVVLMGPTEDPITGVTVLPNRYDIKNMLRAIASGLKVSAKDMANKEVGQYFPVPTELVSLMTKSHCQVFQRIEVSDGNFEYKTVVEAEELIIDQVIELREAGVSCLYVDANERLRFINRASTLLVDDLSRADLSRSEKLSIASQGQNVIAEEIFAEEEINEEMAAISKLCIHSIRDVMENTPAPQLKNLLKALLESKSGYVYQHGILTTFLATKIIEHISWGTKEQAEKVAFALFFHDMYLLPIYKKFPDAISEEDLLFRNDVSDSEKQLVIEHAKLAAGMLKTFPRAPIGADMIVAQHHGMTSGEGFATNYKDDISPLSKIMIVAEEVATGVLLRKQAGKKELINKKAMVARLADRFRTTAFKKVVEAFAKVDI
jgi:HD-GYP domain-containing protein (c-di-GMP phosphodiesterase class II)